MKKNIFKESIPVGLAMFSMFFGAGNIIFPLAVGQHAGQDNLYAMLGLILTASIIPITGVLAMILYEGDYRGFFCRLGRWPGFFLALVIISLLGPLGSTPRCIALSYTTLKSAFLDFSVTSFSFFYCVLIFFLAVRKNQLLTLLGWVLTPVLLGSLLIIITLGFLTPHELYLPTSSPQELFFFGLKEGYNTMDLLAAFFFSSTILHILRGQVESEKNPKAYLKVAAYASFIGAGLLSLVYVGFSYLAAFHGSDLSQLAPDALLAALTLKVAGPYAGSLVCITIALACLTTTIALISSFADFVQKEVFEGRGSYEWILACSLLVTFFVSTYEFTGISAFLGPVLTICYPGLILLTLLNIAYRLKGYQSVKVPVFIAFMLSALHTLM